MHCSDALDAAVIQRGLAAQGEPLAVEVRERCESTNSVVLARADPRAPLLLISEEQTAGRGRRGRRWQSAPGAALTFSLGWAFGGPVGRLRGLSLAVGVALASTLRALGARGVGLKWPNDLLACADESGGAPAGNAGGKLGGVLVETRSGAGRTCAVVGVGLNVRRVPGLDARLGRTVAALEDVLAPLPARNALAARLAADLARTLRAFDHAGLAPFRADWQALHALQGERLRVRTGDGRVLAGIAAGIADDGALLLRNRRGLHRVSDGTVMRAAQGAPA